MMSKKNSKKDSKPGIFKRLIRATFSIVVLSTLVLGITFLVRELSNLNVTKIEKLTTTLGIESPMVGEVAGNFAVRVSSTDISLNKENVVIESNNEAVVFNDIASAKSNRMEIKEDSKLLFKVAIFADSHNDIDNLSAAVESARDEKVKSIIHLGDITDLGLIEDLEKSKEVLESSNMAYYAIPGDRDLWKSVGPENFKTVFGDNFHSVVIEGVKFLVLDNSANYSTIPDVMFQRFLSEVPSSDYVLLSQPLYLTNSSKVMGSVDGDTISKVKEQADIMLAAIRKSNVRAVISAEQHISSESVDIEKPQLMHIVVGAITTTINDKPQKILQSSRYSLLSIYQDKSYDIKEIVL